MRPGTVLVLALLALLATTFAAEDSCMDRCENGFDAQKSCQCDSMCRYYQSCCSDSHTTCHMTKDDDDDDDEDLSDIRPKPSRSPSEAPDTFRPTPPPSLHTSPPVRTTGPLWEAETTKASQTGPLWEAETTRASQTGPLWKPETTKAPRTRDQKTTMIPITRKVHVNPKVPVMSQQAQVQTTTPAPALTTTEAAQTTTPVPDPDADPCSGRPFDSFMQLKNGTLYAFRGEYFFALGERSVLPGYPKLIHDVWGIRGPIDAAFTRINCQGKTYIFKGNQYWRFDDGLLEEDYPRDISVGFDKIPDHVDAAFSLPAPSHHGKEKVYFFKSDQYYLYEFLHQPSHEECVSMSAISPSALFRQYTDAHHYNHESFFSLLYSNSPTHHGGHHFINKDWVGIKSPVDAVLAGRIYVSSPRTIPRRRDHRPDQQRGHQWGQQYDQQWGQQYDQQRGQQWGQQYDQQWGRRRQSRSSSWESFTEQGMGMGQGFAERGMDMGRKLAEKGIELGQRLAERGMELDERLGGGWDRRRDGYRRSDSDRGDQAYRGSARKGQPLQSVYFFKGDKYYRVDLKTKRVERASPPYPRSIAKYWLGCSGSMGAERK